MIASVYYIDTDRKRYGEAHQRMARKGAILFLLYIFLIIAVSIIAFIGAKRSSYLIIELTNYLQIIGFFIFILAFILLIYELAGRYKIVLILGGAVSLISNAIYIIFFKIPNLEMNEGAVTYNISRFTPPCSYVIGLSIIGTIITISAYILTYMKISK